MTETLLQSYPQVRTQTAPPSGRRNGKIARLPRATRDMINKMLDDGLPYHVILEELGEAGEGINTQNLTNWKQGGYQDWVKHQELIERIRIQTEFAIDLLRQTGDVNPALVTEACHMVAATQLLQNLLRHGDDAVKKLLVDKPQTYISILNVICRLADSGLRYDKHRLLVNQTQAKSSSIKPNQGPTKKLDDYDRS
jgi:hypothetical protein